MRVGALVVAVAFAAGGLLVAKSAAQLTPGGEGSGPFGLEVRVEDHRGRDLEGTEVTLMWLDGSRVGPSPAKSGPDGRVRFTGLAPGRWELVARHEGQMSYVAELVVTGDKPRVVTARHENVRGAIAPMRLRITKGPIQVGAPTVPRASVATPPERGTGRSEPAIRPASPPTPVPAPPALSKVSQTPSVVAKSPASTGGTGGTPVATVPPPPIPPSPATQPAPLSTPRPSEATPVAPKQEPAAPTSAPRMPSSPASTSATPLAAEPAPPTAAPPSTRLPSAPGAAPGKAVEPALLRRYADHTCPECPPGESSLSVEIAVGGAGGAAGCSAEAVARFAGLASSQWAEGAGSLPETCSALLLALPVGARFTGYRYEAAADGRYQDCPAGRDCPGISCSWMGDPIVAREGEATKLAALFANRAERDRRARFTAYFREGKPRR